ncbi:Auxin-induced protein 5NG4 [Hordeum vulgare]|nr:Auxin-induced protein 5NG4 [Hordeum vulgare]
MFVLPPTVAEMRYPAFVVVERSLRMWSFSHWRSARELVKSFLRTGFSHLPDGSPRMFCLEEDRPINQAPAIGLFAHFTTRFDAYYLLGKVFWCCCEFIAFTTYNIFTDFKSIFPSPNRMHNLSYYLGENGREEEE